MKQEGGWKVRDDCGLLVKSRKDKSTLEILIFSQPLIKMMEQEILASFLIMYPFSLFALQVSPAFVPLPGPSDFPPAPVKVPDKLTVMVLSRCLPV